jgi:hypothetical protein
VSLPKIGPFPNVTLFLKFTSPSNIADPLTVNLLPDYQIAQNIQINCTNPYQIDLLIPSSITLLFPTSRGRTCISADKPNFTFKPAVGKESGRYPVGFISRLSASGRYQCRHSLPDEDKLTAVCLKYQIFSA